MCIRTYVCNINVTSASLKIWGGRKGELGENVRLLLRSVELAIGYKMTGVARFFRLAALKVIEWGNDYFLPTDIRIEFCRSHSPSVGKSECKRRPSPSAAIVSFDLLRVSNPDGATASSNAKWQLVTAELRF